MDVYCCWGSSGRPRSAERGSAARVRGLVLRVQPGLEEAVQVAAGEPFRQRGEVGDRAGAAAPRRGPLGEQPEERVVADGHAQRVHGQRPADVHRPGEQRSAARVAGLGPPVPGVRRRVVALVERGLRGRAAGVLLPQPLGVGGEALVEPDVAPLRQRDAVAEPLVRHLVRDDRGRRDLGRVEERRRVDRPGLRLQRERQPLADHDPAGRLERVRAELRGQEPGHLGRALHGPVRDAAGRQPLVDRRVHRFALVRPLEDPEPADHDRAQVGRHG